MAGVLSEGKNSRLYKRLVYELQVAQDVSAVHDGQGLASTFGVVVTARAGHDLEEILRLVDEEIAKLEATPPRGARAATLPEPDTRPASTTAWSASAASAARRTC